MKKLFFLLLSVVLFSTVAGAQDENRENGKVILKNGSVIEGTISKQGNDIVVTTAVGDVFYYSASEIARISRSDAGTSKGVKTDVNSQSTASKSGFKAFKKNTRAAYREAKAFGADINKYWGTNDKAKYYYEKSRKWNKAAWITASAGGVVFVSGIIFNVAYLETFEYERRYDEQGRPTFEGPAYYNEGYYAATIVGYLVGGTALLASCFLPIGSHINLKRSYEYYDHEGKSHTAVFNASPVLYAQGGAGIGVTLNF